MHFKLITFSTNKVTTGNLYLQSDEICHTVELPWNHNKPNISCIPAGTYNIEPVDSPKFGRTYEVKDVIGRTHILFHAANVPSELKGCIAPVASFGILGDEFGGFASGKALNKLLKLLDNKSHTLEIKRY